MEHTFKEQSFLKTKMAKLSQKFTRNPQTHNNTFHFKSQHLKSCIKSISYTLARRICTIIINKKKLRKTHLKELHVTLDQRGYPATIINKGFELAEKYH